MDIIHIVGTAVILIIVIAFVIFFLRGAVERKKQEKADRQMEQMIEKRQKEYLLRSAMEKASRENLATAEMTLFDVGIWVEKFGKQVKVKLPEFFWEASGPILIAKTLITLVKSNEVSLRNKIYADLLAHFLELDKERSMPVLMILLESDIGRSFSCYIIAYGVIKLR